jgi:hypothetical protein
MRTRRLYALAVAAALVVLVVSFLVIWARPAIGPGTANGADSGPGGSVLSTPVVPTPTEKASSAQLPSPGGTCSADQFVLGEPVAGPGYGTLGTMVVFVIQPIRNRGEECLLELPSAIGVASAYGPFHAVSIRNAVPGTSWKIGAGRSKSLVLGGSWWTGVRGEDGKPVFTAPPCADPVHDVTRVEFPLARGTIEIDLPTPWEWQEVCSSPGSVTVDVEN